MFSQLLAPERYAETIEDFRAALQEELVERGERESSFGPYALPVDYPTHLTGMGQYYIRIHQNVVNGEELDNLIETASRGVWGDPRVCSRIS